MDYKYVGGRQISESCETLDTFDTSESSFTWGPCACGSQASKISNDSGESSGDDDDIEYMRAWLGGCCGPVTNMQVDNLLHDYSERGLSLPMMLVSGPGVILARRAVAVLWLVVLMLPLVAASVMDCPREGQYAQPPKWLWFVVIVPTIMVLVCLENEILSYVLLVLLSVDRTIFLFIDYTTLPVIAWRMLVSILGICGKLQLISNSLFVAKAVKMRWCTGVDNKLEDAWEIVWSQSIFGYLHIPCISYAGVVIIVGLLHIGELVHVLMLTIPLRPKETPDSEDHLSANFCTRTYIALKEGQLCSGEFKVDYDIPESYSTARGHVYEYATLSDTQQNHGASLMMLSNSARLVPVTSLEFRYDRLKMDRHLRDKGRNYKFRYLHHVHHMLSVGMHSFVAVGLVQCVCQLNLQVTLMSLSSVALRVGHPDGLTVASLILNSVVLLLKLKNAWQIRVIYFEADDFVCTDAEGIRHEHPVRLEGTTERELWQRIRRLYWYFRLLLVLYPCGLLYAIQKIIAFYICEDNLFNVTGCVEMI